MNAMIIFKSGIKCDILHYYGIQKVVYGKRTIMFYLNKNYAINDSEIDAIKEYNVGCTPYVHEYYTDYVDKFAIVED
jgi:hypothetical protein